MIASQSNDNVMIIGENGKEIIIDRYNKLYELKANKVTKIKPRDIINLAGVCLVFKIKPTTRKRLSPEKKEEVKNLESKIQEWLDTIKS